MSERAGDTPRLIFQTVSKFDITGIYLGMAIMLLSDYGGYIGLSYSRVRQLAQAGRITGITVLKKNIRIVDTATARILPPPNTERRTTGKVIGRSKPLRGEEGFKEK